MEQLIKYIAFISLITACTKTSVPAPTVDDSHEIIVSIADSQFGTKCTLDSNKTYFSPGDQIMVVSKNGSLTKEASYKYVRKISDGGDQYVFQKNMSQPIDTNYIVAAFYPASWYGGYSVIKSVAYLTASFPEVQEYKETGSQTISAPMAFFGDLSSGKLMFTNISCLLQIGITCSTIPENEIKVQTIKVSSTNFSVASDYDFSQYLEVSGPVKEKFKLYTVSLTGCESAGSVSTEVKYYYVILPPISNDESFVEGEDVLTVEVSFVNHSTISKKFTIRKGSKINQMIKNKILKFEIKIDPE